MSAEALRTFFAGLRPICRILPAFGGLSAFDDAIEELRLDSKPGNALKRSDDRPLNSSSVSGFRDGLQPVLQHRPQPPA
jgi:hypothetical protein